MKNFDKRLLFIFEKFELNASSFADKIGVQRSSMSHILSGRNKPSLDFILKIYETFPDVSLTWLTLGEGEFYKKDNLSPTLNPTFSSDTNDEILENEVSKNEFDLTEKQSSNTESLSEIISPKNVDKIEEQNQFPIENTQSEIEQILFFYKDGTFKSYRPK